MAESSLPIQYSIIFPSALQPPAKKENGRTAAARLSSDISGLFLQYLPFRYILFIFYPYLPVILMLAQGMR
jgi:hypothetical protein